jgi:hypothetical protein
MKRIIVFAGLIISSLSVMAQAELTIDGERDYNMGTFNEGEEAVHVFTFTNTGTTNLVIEDVRTTCSCTVSDWPKYPILPGKQGSIKVTFDTNGKSGTYAKGVNIFSNAGETNLIVQVTVNATEKTKQKLKTTPVTPPPHNHDHDHDDHNH